MRALPISGAWYLLVKVGISAADVTEVALEVLDVDCVKADDGRVKTDVRFGQAVAEVVWPTRLLEIGLGAVKRSKELLDSGLVGFLGSARSQRSA